MDTNLATTILIVDDDSGIRAGTRIRLETAGYQTLEATDGRQGITMAIEHGPDAVLLDVRMPNMDGLTALRLLQKSETTRHIPVVMLSASHVDQTQALDSGARFFLTKPYQAPRMLETIEAALDR